MKGPITGVEVKWREIGVEDETAWNFRRFPVVRQLRLADFLPEGQYEIGLRYLGPVPSGWTETTHTVAATTRQGVRALPPGIFGNVGSRWLSGATVTWSATDTLATIDVSAGDLKSGDDAISYSASSAQVSGTAGEVKTVHLYYDDPKSEGGARTLGVTEDINDTVGYSKVYIASLPLTFDSAGGTGTGGGGSIGGGGGGSGQYEP